MENIYFICCFIALPSWAAGQESDLKNVINQFFESMYKRDTTALRKAFIPAAQLYTYSHDSKGNPRAKGETVSDFIHGVASIGEAKMEERLTSWQFMIDEGVASVWTPYEFYFEDKFSHCGIDSWELIQVQGEWKISQLTDTRRKGNCHTEEDERKTLDSLINQWHHAAAIADENAFFGFMTKEAIYIGTDSTERWYRDELREWSKVYFDKNSAWDFTPLSRNITFGSSKSIAWFDELLDTWMGVCRSTGVLEKIDGQWKLVHYQLSLTLPNDKLEDFKKLIGRQ